MSEMIERVARALARSNGDGAYWHAYLRQALAAIEAMHEPTEAMFMAGSNAEPYDRAGTSRMHGRRIGDLPARDCWRLMIERALKSDRT